jgi:glycosyltransferase involved in cell wall biosynthesis
VYNGQRFIEEALQSILNQTFTDFELIISDNASTDRTSEIVEAFARRDDRIRYYRSEKNMGAGWNARRVYELATGKYFKWATADDLIEPDLLRRCVEILERDSGCVVAFASTKEVDENGKFIKNYVTPMTTDSSDQVARFRGILTAPGWMCYQIYGVMRMDALRKIPPQGSYINADGVLLTRMSLLGRFHEIPEYLFVSRRHAEQSSAVLPVRVTDRRRIRLTNRHCTLPCPEWWDPTKARALTFPEFRRCFEYFLSISCAPLGIGQKLHCYLIFLRWMINRPQLRRLLKDLLVAADQGLYNLQTAKMSQTTSEHAAGLLGRKKS